MIVFVTKSSHIIKSFVIALYNMIAEQRGGNFLSRSVTWVDAVLFPVL